MPAFSTATVLALAGVAASVGGTAFSALSPRGGGAPPQSQMPQAPSYTDPAIQAAARAQETATANARGRQSTILTGGGGDTSTVTTAKRDLLGIA